MPTLKNKIRVVLAVNTSLAGDVLREELQQSEDFEIVAEVSSPLELLHHTETDEADAVVLELQNDAEMPGVLTHLFAEFPRILAIALARSHNRAVVYRQDIHKQVYEGLSLHALLVELRSADTEYWARV